MIDCLEEIPIDDSSILFKASYDLSEDYQRYNIKENNLLQSDEKEENSSNIILESPNFTDEDTYTSKLQNLEAEDMEGFEGENQRYPILFVDINLGKNQVERITIYEGE